MGLCCQPPNSPRAERESTGARRRRGEEASLHRGAGEDPPPRGSGRWASPCLTAVWGVAAAEFGRPTCQPAQPVHSWRSAPRSGPAHRGALPRGDTDALARARSHACSCRRGETGSKTAQGTGCTCTPGRACATWGGCALRTARGGMPSWPGASTTSSQPHPVRDPRNQLLRSGRG